MENKSDKIQQELGCQYLGALPDHYARSWVERGELRLLCKDNFTWVSKFYLATRPESARRRAVDLFIQDIMQTIDEARFPKITPHHASVTSH